MQTKIDVTREQAIGASRHYLAVKGYEINGTWESEGLCGLVASDEESLAFIQVQFQESDAENEQKTSGELRSKFERAAVAWLADNERCCDGEFPVRFDIISFLLVSEKRALLRHQVNALSAC